MTVIFRPIRLGHTIDVEELSRQVERGDISQFRMVEFVMQLVKSWDYTDIETGEPIPIDQPRQLSLAQFNDLMLELGQQMKAVSAVNPQNGVSLSSGSTPSRPARRNSRKPQPG